MKPSLFSLLVAGVAASSLALADTAPVTGAWSVGTGADYSRGAYGFATDTEVFSVPATVSYDANSWLFTASVPWLTIKGPAAITGTGGAARPTAASESGLGDLVAGGTYRFGEVFGPVNLAFTGRVKLPTADDAKGLGTGETDFYGQLDFYRTFVATTLFGSVGYRALGDSALYRLEDGLYASVGAHFRVSPETVWTLAGNWGQRIIAGGDPTTDVMLAFNHDWSPQWRCTVYALKGFTDASPDFGTGLAISRKF